MEIVWEEEAEQQLQEVVDYYIKLSALHAAEVMNEKINRTAIQLKIFPYMGIIEPELKDAHLSYRSIVAHQNYKIIYRVDGDIVYITGIWDCRQNPQRMPKVVTPLSED